MEFRTFKLTIKLALAIGCLGFNIGAHGNDLTCEVAATAKKINNLQEVYGEQTWEVRLAVAELLSKYNPNKPDGSKSKFQIDHEMSVLFNAIVAGNLSADQSRTINDYKKLLARIVESSALISRTKLNAEKHDTKIRQDRPIAESIGEILVPVPAVHKNDTSVFANLIDILNPVLHLSKDARDEKQFGPQVPFQYANQMATVIEGFSPSERLPALKYMLENVPMLSPLEGLRLLIEIPKELQVDAFAYLNTKIVGRFDFFSESILEQSKDYLAPRVMFKIITDSGSNWPIAGIMPLLKEMSGISQREMIDLFKTLYTHAEMVNYLGHLDSMDINESKLWFSVMAKNPRYPYDVIKYYPVFRARLTNAADKPELAKVYMDLTSSPIGKMSPEETLIGNLSLGDFNKLKVGLDKQKLSRLILVRLATAKISSADSFNEVFDSYVLQGENTILSPEQLIEWQHAIDHFLDLDPSIEQINKLRKHLAILNGGDIPLLRSILESGRIKTASEFIQLLQRQKYTNSTQEYLLKQADSLNHLWGEFADRFVELNPTAKEFDEAKLAIVEDLSRLLQTGSSNTSSTGNLSNTTGVAGAGLTPRESNSALVKLVKARLEYGQEKTETEIAEIISTQSFGKYSSWFPDLKAIAKEYKLSQLKSVHP